MSAPTEVYVDPSIAADSGSGTIGDPYGDLQYALDQTTRDSTNGDRFNIKAGTAELPSATLDFSTYGSPSVEAPIIFQGYTSTAGDGGQGEIDGGDGDFSLLPATEHQIVKNVKLHNTGTASILGWQTIRWNLLVNCEFATCTNDRAVWLGAGCRAIHCHFSGGWSSGKNVLEYASYGVCWGNYFALDAAVDCAISFERCQCYRNIISISHTGASAIRVVGVGGIVDHNSIFSSVACTGDGIELLSNSDGVVVTNNLVEGFSGTGGVAVRLDANDHLSWYEGNGFYNNETNEENVSGQTFIAGSDNESLASSPFAKSGTDNFANRGVYFEPQDVGNVRGGAYPTALRLDKGAVQHADPAGGGGGLLRNPGMNGGLV